MMGAMLNRAPEANWVAFRRAFVALPILFVVISFSGCSSESLDEPVKAKKVSAIMGEKEKPKEMVVTSSKKRVRAWINSITLEPPLPNKDQMLAAIIDWGPQGQPDITVGYQWFVNGEEFQMEAEEVSKPNTLGLNGFRSGDRIFLMASLIRPDGSVADTERSLSTIIQNRPPELGADFKGFEKKEDYLVGKLMISDPDGDGVEVALLEGPEGLTVDSEGTVFWPLSQVTSGDHQLTLELEDERGLGFRGTISFSMETKG